MAQPSEMELLGVSFRTAPAAVREALSFDAPATAVLLRMLAEEMPGCEALVLSTCNRTEFYLVPPAGAPGATETFLGLLRRLRPEAPILRADCPRYRLTGTEAVRHLLRVACGLHSQILGDGQILGQLRAAVTTARENRTIGRVLEWLTQDAVRTAKRVRRETALGAGSASIGAAIAGMVASFAPRTTVVIGAGVVARDVSRQLAKRGAGRVVILNRTRVKAAEIAADAGAEDQPWEALVDMMVEADVVVTATSAPAPILGPTLLDGVIARRLGKSLVVIDAGMPRNVAPGVGVTIVGINAIREECAAVVTERRAAVPLVERIVDDAVAAYEAWRSSRDANVAIEALFEQASDVSREAAAMLAGASRAAEDIARVFLHSFQRLVHGHVRMLRGHTPLSTSRNAPTPVVGVGR